MTSGYIVLQHDGASAAISRRGAELRQWSVDGRDLLWNAEGVWWDAVSPLLFPIVGRAHRRRLHIDGREYAMSIHGFIAEQAFEVLEVSANRAKLRAKDTAATREGYPFPFQFDVTYELTDRELIRTVEISNPGTRELPYAFGTHTGFAWPFAGGRQEDYVVEFEHEESPLIPVTTPNGLFAPEQRAAPLEGKRLPLSPEVFSKDALCFFNTNSRKVTFSRPGHGAIAVTVENLPHWGIWSRYGSQFPSSAPFLCIEPWSGYGDPEGFEGDIRDKPSMRFLKPGETETYRTSYLFSS